MKKCMTMSHTVHQYDDEIEDPNGAVTNYQEMGYAAVSHAPSDPEAFNNMNSSNSDENTCTDTDSSTKIINNLSLLDKEESNPPAAHYKDNFQDNPLPPSDLVGAPSFHTTVSTVMTADGIADPVSFKVNCFIVFLGDMTRGIFFPTMWNLVQTLGGDQVLLGCVIASFSFGRMLVLPLFGSWSTSRGYKYTLQFSTYILLIGTLLFAQVLNVRRQWFLVLANTIMGIGSGTLGVTFAYASEVTPKRKRTGYLAWVAAVQYAGTTATPFLGSLFIKLFSNHENNYYYNNANNYKGFPEINEFTAPALFMTLSTIFSLFLLSSYFEDRKRESSKKKQSSRQKANEEVANTTVCCGLFSIRTCCLVGCMLLNAFTKGPMSCFETLGIEFAESRFDMHRSDAGMIVATMGFIGAILLLFMGFLSDRIDDTLLTMGGIFFFVSGVFINTLLDQDNANSPWKYTISMFLCYSIGYPICHTALVGLFSKIVGRIPQGTLQGFFSASGSIARITFPILSGYIVSQHDIEAVFTLLVFVLSFSMIFLFVFRDILTLLAS